MSEPADEMGASALAWHAGAFVATNLVVAVLFFVNKGRVAVRDINGIFDYWPLWIHVAWLVALGAHVAIARRRQRIVA